MKNTINFSIIFGFWILFYASPVRAETPTNALSILENFCKNKGDDIGSGRGLFIRRLDEHEINTDNWELPDKKIGPEERKRGVKSVGMMMFSINMNQIKETNLVELVDYAWSRDSLRQRRLPLQASEVEEIKSLPDPATLFDTRNTMASYRNQSVSTAISPSPFTNITANALKFTDNSKIHSPVFVKFGRDTYIGEKTLEEIQNGSLAFRAAEDDHSVTFDITGRLGPWPIHYVLELNKKAEYMLAKFKKYHFDILLKEITCSNYYKTPSGLFYPAYCEIKQYAPVNLDSKESTLYSTEIYEVLNQSVDLNCYIDPTGFEPKLKPGTRVLDDTKGKIEEYEIKEEP